MKKKIAVLSAIVVLFSVLVPPMTAVVNAVSEFSYTISDGVATLTAYNGNDTDIVVPDTLGGAPVTAIGNNVFASSNAVSVTLPDGVQTIGECAFQNARELKTLTLGTALGRIEFSALSGCAALQTVHFGGTQAMWSRVEIHGCNEVLASVAMTFGGTAYATQSLLPASTAAFTAVAVNNNAVGISRGANGAYTFRSSAGWPYAYVDYGTENGITVDTATEQYLNYEFEVTTGRTNIAVFFNSPDPHAPAEGSYICLNGHVDPRNIDAAGVVTDLRPGYYKGSIKISDLGCRADLMTDGTFVLSGFRVYAVTSGSDGAGNVTVYDLSVGSSVAEAEMPAPARDGDVISLLPANANGFVKDYSQGPVYVTKESTGFRFESYYSWPYAYTEKAASEYVSVDVTANHYLYFDFTVTAAETNICVFFGGTHPLSDSTYGTFVSLNGLVDPANVNGGIVTDIGMGTYRGCVRIGDLGLHPSVLSGNLTTVSDVKVFAVSDYEPADILVREIAVIKAAEDTPPADGDDGQTTTTTTVAPQETVTYTVGDVTGSVGDIVETTICVSDGHYMTNGQILVHYDADTLELQAVSADADNPYVAALNREMFCDEPLYMFRVVAPGTARLAFASAGRGGVATGGVLFTLSFKILDTAISGTSITLTIPEMRSGVWRDGQLREYDTPTAVAAGVVSVNGKPLRGDVTLDGIVDIADATHLFRAVNGRVVLTDEQRAVAELNDDGVIDITDATTLFRFVNGRIRVL